MKTIYTDLKTATKVIIIANFLGTFLYPFKYDGTSIVYWLGFMPSQVLVHFEVWRLFSYSFIHPSLSNFLYNMVPFFLLAEPVEKVLGKREFILLYFGSTFAGAICLLIVNSMEMFVNSTAGVYGVAVLFAILFPNRFIFWSRLKVKYIIWFFAFAVMVSPLLGFPDWRSFGAIIFGVGYGLWKKNRGIDTQNEDFVRLTSRSRQKEGGQAS